MAHEAATMAATAKMKVRILVSPFNTCRTPSSSWRKRAQSSDPGRLRYHSRTALARQIRPDPLALHAQSVLQLRQGENVNDRPHQPRQETACAQPTPLKHSVILAYDRHIALVEIAERTFYFSALQLLRDQPPDVASFLNRGLRNAGHRVFVLHDRCRIAHDEHAG